MPDTISERGLHKLCGFEPGEPVPDTVTGWVREVRGAYANDLYAVLVRPVQTATGIVQHCAIRTASNAEPPWSDKQRIKDELFGPERLAVEVMPARENLVDAADMYHMWVLPAGAQLDFGLAREGREALASAASTKDQGDEHGK